MSETVISKIQNPKFQLIKSHEDKLYYFQLRAVNGKVILISESYNSKKESLKDIGIIKAKAFEPVLEDSQGGYAFKIKSKKGHPIGKSKLYTTPDARENGLRVIQRDAPVAPVQDLTRE